MALQIDGTEVMTMPDIATLAGTTVEAIRQRQKRGSLKLTPYAVIGRQTFYDAGEVRSRLRQEFGL